MPNSSADLLKRGEARWEQLLTERPDLAPAIDLQRALVTRLIELETVLERDGLPQLSLAPADISGKLARGIPVLRGEDISLPLALLGPLIVELCDHLARGGAGEVALHIRETLASGRIDTGSLLRASLARTQHAIRTKATHVGLAPDLLWLVAEMSVGPLAHALQRRLLTGESDHGADRDVGEALAAWDRGYCPACGSWPALAEVCQGRRALRCSFCGAAWQLRTCRCTYCSEAAERFVTTAPDLERPGRRLELCGRCRGYLKSVELGDVTPFALLPVEDLASSDLDVAAMEQEYVRPSLPDIGIPQHNECGDDQRPAV